MKITENEPSYEEFIGACVGIGRARFEMTSKENRDLFEMPIKYSLMRSVTADLDCRGGIVWDKIFCLTTK